MERWSDPLLSGRAGRRRLLLPLLSRAALTAPEFRLRPRSVHPLWSDPIPLYCICRKRGEKRRRERKEGRKKESIKSPMGRKPDFKQSGLGRKRTRREEELCPPRSIDPTSRRRPPSCIMAIRRARILAQHICRYCQPSSI